MRGSKAKDGVRGQDSSAGEVLLGELLGVCDVFRINVHSGSIGVLRDNETAFPVLTRHGMIIHIVCGTYPGITQVAFAVVESRHIGTKYLKAELIRMSPMRCFR